MPVQTAIQVRRGTASSWTSTNPTLAAGEIGFETDTSKFKIGTGSTAWNSLSYFVQDPVTTKGDLYTFSTTDARLPVGANGETLVADSSTSTGLRWQGNFAAGKNAVINGDFRIWQRGTSFTNPGNTGAYTADRYTVAVNAATTSHTVSQQSFTAGAAPVSGYEAPFFYRSLITTPGSCTVLNIQNRIEDVRTFAGQTVTFSFWAKADTTRAVSVDYYQVFGSGGSGTVSATLLASTNLTTGWVRYSATVTLPSISGKTIGTNSYLAVVINQTVAAGSTLDIWGVQLEAGNTATAFQTATGTLAGELAACQRYYERFGQTANVILFNTMCYSTLETYGSLPYLVQKRTTPTISFNSTANFVIVIGGATKVPTASGAGYISNKAARVQFNTTGLTAGQAAWIETDGGTNAFIEVSAEL